MSFNETVYVHAKVNTKVSQTVTCQGNNISWHFYEELSYFVGGLLSLSAV